MAITTGAELATAVANWLARVDLTSRIPEFVALAEAKFNRTLRTRDMETTNAAFSISGEYVNVPTGFLQFKSGYLNTADRVPIQYLPDDTQIAWYQGETTGEYPGRYVSVVGSQFHFAPIPTSAVTATITYYVGLTTVSTGGSAVNWLLTNHPDVYLYGALCEASDYIQDDGRAQKWQQKLVESVRLVKRADNLSRATNGMQIRPA